MGNTTEKIERKKKKIEASIGKGGAHVSIATWHSMRLGKGRCKGWMGKRLGSGTSTRKRKTRQMNRATGRQHKANGSG